MGLDKGKIITIVQLGFSLLAFILSIVALAGGVADYVDGLLALKSAGWMSMEYDAIEFGRVDSDLYWGWSHYCIKFRGQSQDVYAPWCNENRWDKKDAATAMGALSFLFALANLVLVAVKLFKPNKMLSIIGCGVCFLGMIFTLACFGIFAGDDTSDAFRGRAPALVADASYGPGFGSSVTCFVFLLIALVLGVISLLPGMATTEVTGGQ